MAEGTQGLRELSDQGHTLKLPDGRVLGYQIYGSEGGAPAFYFHGFPGSRLEAGFVATPGLRLIAVDRPGYGLSSPQPRRRLNDWPADVAALADALTLDRFAVLGISGGAPYALACAAALPERLAGVAIVGGLGPPEAAGMRDGMMPGLLGLGRNRFVLVPLAMLGRHMISGRRAEPRFVAFRRRMMARLAAGVPKEQAVSTDALSRHLFRAWREGLRPSISGLVSDARIYATPWPLDLSAIKVSVHLWHGSLDRIVPVSVAHHYALHIPRLVAHIPPDEGHFSVIFNALPEIVRTLIEAGR